MKPMTMIIHPMNTDSTSTIKLPGGVAPLPHLGVIRVSGEDAAKFLQGQLTQDFVLLGMNEARLAAFCSAKGRMQASFIGFKRQASSSAEETPSTPDILLICSRDILAPTLKRLSMFVMRAKAKLSDATADFALYGLAGDAFTNATNTIAPQAINTPASAPISAPFKVDFGNSTLVALYPALGQSRALWITPVGEPAPGGEAMSTELWQWGEVYSGIATITAPIVEAFVPQMLNYESVGGVNFKKGCYPGQEVVARSQFRGTLKRRAFLVQIDAPDAAPAVGQDVFHDSDAEQACGTMAQVAVNPNGGFSAIVSMQVAASTGGKLTLGAPNGPMMALQALPYALLEDI